MIYPLSSFYVFQPVSSKSASASRVLGFGSIILSILSLSYEEGRTSQFSCFDDFLLNPVLHPVTDLFTCFSKHSPDAIFKNN